MVTVVPNDANIFGHCVSWNYNYIYDRKKKPDNLVAGEETTYF